VLLFFEASEGGAGVLRRLVEEHHALNQVARTALELCHFDPESREDQKRAPRAREDCEAACYDCLLSYFNQREHRILDRKLLPDLLYCWSTASIAISPTPRPREEHLERLIRLTGSELERRWLRFIEQMGLKLPSDAQVLIETCHVRPDFAYADDKVAVFIDGPHHDAADQKDKDRLQQNALDDHGYTVIRFHHAADWEVVVRKLPSIFGRPTAPSDLPPRGPAQSSNAGAPARQYDPDLFDARWHALLDALSALEGIAISPGEEVTRGGRVVDQDLGRIARGEKMVHLVDAGAKTGSDVAAALEARGARVVRIRDGASDLVDRILAMLES
jgi:very-short-patch-repair endonuclease